VRLHRRQERRRHRRRVLRVETSREPELSARMALHFLILARSLNIFLLNRNSLPHIITSSLQFISAKEACESALGSFWQTPSWLQMATRQSAWRSEKAVSNERTVLTDYVFIRTNWRMNEGLAVAGVEGQHRLTRVVVLATIEHDFGLKEC